MTMEYGFSLTEVLVSLLLMTATSLALLKQQWLSIQLFNQIHLQTQALTQLDSATEQMMAGLRVSLMDDRFKFTQKWTDHVAHLHVTWNCISQQNQTCELHRALIAK